VGLLLWIRVASMPKLKTLLRVLVAGMVSLGVSMVRADPADSGSDDLINPDRPGIADGSNVVGSNRFQIETAIQQELRGNSLSGSEKMFIPTLLRFGLDKSWGFVSKVMHSPG
jgi:hypothetical protein